MPLFSLRALLVNRFARAFSCAHGVWERGSRVGVLLVLLGTGATTTSAEIAWQAWLSPELRTVEREEAAAKSELAALGTPVVGQTVAEYGYQHPRLRAEPPTSPWIQVDLERTQRIDWIALVPAQVDWQAVEHKAHAFPRRFRIDVSDDPQFANFSPVAVYTDSDFPPPGIAPVTVRANGQSARYVRLTVTKLAVENGQYFYALAELMVLSGRRNIAIGRPVLASAAVDLPPRWTAANVVDGRTPLGPPIQRDLLPYDGLYAGPSTNDELPWMAIDLGEPRPIQEVRLHPIHARMGADIPGFSFPTRFRVEAALSADFAQAQVLFTTGGKDFSNPGNNAVTLQGKEVSARYVRVVMEDPGPSAPARTRRRFGLSELEIFADDVNVARGGRAYAVADPAEFSRNWPVSQLNDGYASYGRLIELPAWLADGQRREALIAQLGLLSARREALTDAARSRALAVGAGVLLLLGAVAVMALIQQKRRRQRELEEFRTRLARDLHDEMGSNLAGLAVLSESVGERSSGLAQEDWREVNRIARETTDAMREVLWVVGAREEAGVDLVTQLQRAATRVLPGRDVRWVSTMEAVPPDWPVESQRQVFLFFKEALANVARHAHATTVDLSAKVEQRVFKLVIADNGRGFDPASAKRGVGLKSLRERARGLRGTCTIESSPGKGTTVLLEVPLGAGHGSDVATRNRT
ncbi:MAG: discoidin domain-containing protein [Opitutus sp.]